MILIEKIIFIEMSDVRHMTYFFTITGFCYIFYDLQIPLVSITEVYIFT